jgi:TRAP-type C4-dicarboxylate transport system permease small subunit
MSINGGRAQGAVETIATFLNYFAMGAIALCILLTTADATLRYVFSSGIPGSYHLNEFLLVAIIALPLARCQIIQSHIRVDILIHRIPGRAIHIIEFVSLVLAFILFALAAYTTGENAVIAFIKGDFERGIINYPLWPAKSFVPIGIGVFCLTLLVEIFHHAKGIIKPQSVSDKIESGSI